MKNLFFLLVLLYANLGFGQSIRDIEFIWLDFDDCKPSLYSEDIFVKVEQDPILLDYTRHQLVGRLSEICSPSYFDDKINGFIKIKLLFGIDHQSLCVKSIGTKDLKLTEKTIVSIVNIFNSSIAIKPGIHRDQEVYCLAILYLDIQNCRIHSIRNVNFELAS